MKQKRIAAIHDISGIGKCSLTVALPICSAAGIETAVLPTAILSTHTGGFTGYTFRSLTDDIMPIAKHWKSCKMHFDAFYSGYLGSARQISIVIDAINLLKSSDTTVICDPAMADNGKLYAGFPEYFPSQMLNLCKFADIIVPNITEALMLLGREYIEGPYKKSDIEDILVALNSLTGAKVVLTGVYFDRERLGAACFDGKEISYTMSERVDAFFHGTGDVFASVLTASVLNGKTLFEASQIAVEFTSQCIKATLLDEDRREYGVCFETEIPKLIKFLEK